MIGFQYLVATVVATETGPLATTVVGRLVCARAGDGAAAVSRAPESGGGALWLARCHSKWTTGKAGESSAARIPCIGRDLSVKIRNAVNTQLVNSAVNAEKVVNERAAVEAVAPQTVQLVLSHRRDIQGQRSLAELLKAQLQEATGNRELIEMAIEEETEVAPDAPGYVKAQADQKRRAMLKAVSLPGHVTTLRGLRCSLPREYSVRNASTYSQRTRDGRPLA